MDKVKKDLMKAEVKTASFRIYSKISIEEALNRMKWNQTLPITRIKNRQKEDREDVGFITRADLEYNKETGVLTVSLNPDIITRHMGATIVPFVLINRSRRIKRGSPLTKTEELIAIDDFSLRGVQLVPELNAFPGIDSTLEFPEEKKVKKAETTEIKEKESVISQQVE